MALDDKFESLLERYSFEDINDKMLEEIIELCEEHYNTMVYVYGCLPTRVERMNMSVKSTEVINKLSDIVEQTPAFTRISLLSKNLLKMLSTLYRKNNVDESTIKDLLPQVLARVADDLASKLSDARAGKQIPNIEASKGLLSVIEEDTRKKAMAQINA